MRNCRQLTSIALAEPLNRLVDLAGPDAIPLDEVVRQFLKANRDPRMVITDEQATFFGVPLKQRSLVPDKDQLLGATQFEPWLGVKDESSISDSLTMQSVSRTALLNSCAWFSAFILGLPSNTSGTSGGIPP